MLTRILNSRILLRNNQIIYLFSKGTYTLIKILLKNLTGKVESKKILITILQMIQAKLVNQLHKVNKSMNKKIKQQIFK